jgi:hypothetical protein
MTRLTAPTKMVMLEMHINSERDMVDIVEQIAKTLDVHIGEHDTHEWVQLMHIRSINREPTNAE